MPRQNSQPYNFQTHTIISWYMVIIYNCAPQDPPIHMKILPLQKWQVDPLLLSTLKITTGVTLWRWLFVYSPVLPLNLLWCTHACMHNLLYSFYTVALITIAKSISGLTSSVWQQLSWRHTPRHTSWWLWCHWSPHSSPSHAGQSVGQTWTYFTLYLALHSKRGCYHTRITTIIQCHTLT